MTSAGNETDVLVVGAGPVGLAMACELLRHGVRCRIIDQATVPAQTSRALGIHARTLEVFENMGVVEKALAEGTRAKGLTLYDDDRVILRLSLQHIREKESQYSFLLVLPQSRTERILNERLTELGGGVERSQELLDIRQEDGKVIAFVKAGGVDSGEREEIRARWLIGCDGARSRVRSVLAIPFEGTTAEEEWLLADVDLNWNKTRETTHGWFSRDGLFAVFPLPDGQWRLIAAANQQSSQASLEAFQSLLIQYTGDTRTIVSNSTWMSSFRINYRIVVSYRKGQVFLAGDAAHIHSPFGGQGMNIGIQDAYNLAWKLALVLHGKARENLLDTYEEERRPIARYVVQGSRDVTGGILVTRNPILRWLRDRVVVPLLNLDSIQRMLAQQASELDMNYRHSSLSRSYISYVKGRMNVSAWLAWARAPHAGDRMVPGACLSYPSCEQTNLLRALRGTESHLLLFGGLAPADKEYVQLAELAFRVESLREGCVKAHIIIAGGERPEQLIWNGSILLDPQGELHTIYGARRPSLYFIRPDGYIGLRSQPVQAEQLLDYLRSTFI